MKIKFKIIISVLVLMMLAFFINGIFNAAILTREIKKIRGQQIQNTFLTSFYAIDDFFYHMENNATMLARGGETFYNLHNPNTEADIKNELEKYCLNTLKQFPGIIGNGIWFEPYRFDNQKKYYGVYAFWENGKAKITYEFSNQEYDYFRQNWYTMAIPPDGDKNIRRNDIYISPPYLDKLGNHDVIYITIAGMMYDREGKILGVSTTDWTLDLIKKALDTISFTPNSFVFLVDSKTGKMLYSSDKKSIMQPYTAQKWGNLVHFEQQPANDIMYLQEQIVEKNKYDFYFAKSEHDFVFGVAVNLGEAYAVISVINQQYMIIISMVLLIAGIILFLMITRLMMPLVKLNIVVSQFARHDFSVRAEILYHDEVGDISLNFNTMAEAIQNYSHTLEDYNKNLEILVKERTHEIEQQKEEIEARNQQIVDQNQQLTSINATKDKFFSIIAHDLRNPFNHILGFTELLKNNLDQYDKQEIINMVRIMHNSASSTYLLLENLLLWAGSQCGKINFNPQPANIKELIAGEIETQSEIAEKKEIKLQHLIQSNQVLTVDANMIRTVFHNLITNAIKFTPKGGTVRVSSVCDDHVVIFSVADTGTGMSDEIREKLFRIDQHVTTKGTDNEKGTGLGLVLCKEFVERHGGKIWVESSPGQGSTFMFTIPTIAV